MNTKIEIMFLSSIQDCDGTREIHPSYHFVLQAPVNLLHNDIIVLGNKKFRSRSTCMVAGCGQTFSYTRRLQHYRAAHGDVALFCAVRQCSYVAINTSQFLSHILGRHKRLVKHNNLETAESSTLVSKFLMRKKMSVVGNVNPKEEPSRSIQKARDTHFAPYVCTLDRCPGRFANKSALSDHWLSFHLGVRHHCRDPGCNYHSTTLSLLHSHIHKTHKRLTSKFPFSRLARVAEPPRYSAITFDEEDTNVPIDCGTGDTSSGSRLGDSQLSQPTPNGANFRGEKLNGSQAGGGNAGRSATKDDAKAATASDMETCERGSSQSDTGDTSSISCSNDADLSDRTPKDASNNEKCGVSSAECSRTSPSSRDVRTPTALVAIGPNDSVLSLNGESDFKHGRDLSELPPGESGGDVTGDSTLSDTNSLPGDVKAPGDATVSLMTAGNNDLVECPHGECGLTDIRMRTRKHYLVTHTKLGDILRSSNTVDATERRMQIDRRSDVALTCVFTVSCH